MVLTSRQLKQLQIAVQDGFRSYAELERLVFFELELRLRDVVPPGGLDEVVFQLLVHLDGRGEIAPLVAAIRKERPQNPKVLAFSRLWDALVAGAVAGPVLEGIVRQNQRFLKPRQWREQQELLERRICRIEKRGAALGTGFLVGRDVVLTNFHVVDQAIAAGDATGYQCRFDYYEGVDGEGMVVPFHATDWRLAYSPVHPSDYRPLPKDPEPGKTHLDYAFVVLDRAVSDDLDEERRPRGVVEAPAAVDFGQVQTLAILQHPEGAALSLALDTTPGCEVNEQATRVRYRINTLRGSSGSPCFDSDWRLVALHHSQDPASAMTPAYNEGIPITTIRADLKPQARVRLGW